jgi:hypothetical protein
MDCQGRAFPLNTLGIMLGRMNVSLMISFAYSLPAMSSKLMLDLLVRILPIDS